MLAHPGLVESVSKEGGLNTAGAMGGLFRHADIWDPVG
jgi:hypothetical protein